MEKYLATKKHQLLGVVAKSSDNIKADARINAPADLGTLRSDINYVVKQTSKKIEGEILSAASYSAFVEYGTRPHFPPPDALKGWAARHGMAGAEFAIAKKIAEVGTKPQPFMDPAYRSEKNKFIGSVKDVFNKP